MPRFARQAPAPPSDMPAPPARVARQADPKECNKDKKMAEPEQTRVAREANPVEAEEKNRPVQIRQDSFYSSVVQVAKKKRSAPYPADVAIRG